MPAAICVARIGAPHGVRGAVKLWTFTENPRAVERYGPLTTKDGARQFEIASAREAKDHLVATFKGVATRNDAEKLNGIELYVPRAVLGGKRAIAQHRERVFGKRPQPHLAAHAMRGADPGDADLRRHQRASSFETRARARFPGRGDISSC